MNIKDKILGGFLSLTVWTGFAVMAATWLENNTAMLQGLVDSQYSSLVGYAIGIAIVLLRWKTTLPLEDKLTKNKHTHPSATNYVKKEPTIAKERWEDKIQMSNELDEF